MRRRSPFSHLVSLGALASAIAGAGCSSGATDAGRAGELPAPSRVAPPPACSPAFLDAVPRAEPRYPLRARLLECALTTARPAGRTGAWTMVIDRIAAGFSAAEDHHRAVEVACELAPDVGHRATMLVDVAGALARAGHIDRAIRLAEAIEAAPREEQPPAGEYGAQLPPPNPFDTSEAWTAIATQQAKAGDIARAMESSRRIRSPSVSMVRIALVDALLSQGRAAEAQPLLEEVAGHAASSAMEQPVALVEAAVRYARADQKERAAALLRGAIQKLEGRGKWAQGSRAELAAGLGRIGFHEESIQLLARNGQVQAGLTAELVKGGQMGPARAVAEAIGDGFWRARAMAALAQKQAELRDARSAEQSWQAARDAAVSVAGPRFKVEALADLAVRLAGARRVAEAERMLSEAVTLASSIQDATEKELALREAAVAHAKIGRCVRGLEIARTIGDSGFTIREIAASCADPGDYDEVHARIEDVKYADHRGQALGHVALKYAEAGQLDRALAAVREIEGAEERANALAALGAAALPESTSPLPGCPAIRAPK